MKVPPVEPERLDQLVGLVEDWTGIDLARGGKGETLVRFVRARAAALGLGSLAEYVAQMRSAYHPEVARLVNAVTVAHTWFYRDGQQMEMAIDLIRGAALSGRASCVWVPGCASGEDAYTVAMLAVQAGLPIHVLGTDINSEVLELATKGLYGAWSVREVPPGLRPFLATCGESAFAVSDSVKRTVAFERHNLLEPAPPSPQPGGWDLILCRNVLIYFSRAKTEAAVERLGRALRPGGTLLLGATEILRNSPGDLVAVRSGDRYALRRPAPGERVEPAPAGPPPSVGAGEVLPFIAGPEPPPPPAERTAQSVAALVSLGNARLESGEPAEALGFYAKALEHDPLSAEARFFSGVAYHLSQDPAAAATALRAALLLDPDLWPAAFYLALSYDKLGQTPDALREYRRVVETSDRAPKLMSRSALLADLALFSRDVAATARSRLGRRGAARKEKGGGQR